MKTARDIMTQDVVTVNKTQPISDLSKLFIENHFNWVPVLDDAEKVIGVVTQGDLIEQNKNLRDMFRGLLVEKSNFQIGWNGRNKKSLEPSSIAPTWIHMDVRSFSKKYLQEKYFFDDRAKTRQQRFIIPYPYSYTF